MKLQASFYTVNMKLIKISTFRFFLGGNREGDTPDPIPNSEVKPLLADGTIHKSMEE